MKLEKKNKTRERERARAKERGETGSNAEPRHVHAESLPT